jgi:hypothetical protein
MFYRCGSSISVKHDLGDGSFQLLVKNCHHEENKNLKEALACHKSLVNWNDTKYWYDGEK